jgi:outer membrane protein OmpA-like peptidoglycan-associated protein
MDHTLNPKAPLKRTLTRAWKWIIPAATLVFMLAGIQTSAQIKTAKQEMALYNYSTAVVHLNKVLAKGDPALESEATLLLAECYRMLNDVPNARIWYGKAVKDVNADPSVRFFHARALRSSGEYAAAKMEFLAYLSLVPDDRLAVAMAGWCDSALVWQQAPPAYTVEHSAGLNTPQSEFGVVLYDHGILFTSDRPVKKDEARYGWTGNRYLRLFCTSRQADAPCCDCFCHPEPVTGLANPEGHDGPVSFDGSQSIVFINRTMTFPDRGRKEPERIRTHLLKIFISVRKEETWSKPEPFFLNSDDHSVGHPALTAGGDTLYFVSDMPGGHGGTDLYRCILKEGGWGDPENLGNVINTSGNEMFPMVVPGGDLVFASDGLPGFGGLDIFITRPVDGAWQRPHNPGLPVNSSYDDFSFCPDRGDTTGFFSSNRPGGAGGDDIYCFRRLPVAPLPTPVHADTVAEARPAKAVISSFPVQPELNKKFILKDIYYDLDRWEIRADARPSLDSLVRIMKAWPAVTVELSSHTDCRGSDDYNRKLSQRRAEAAVQYIVQQGIHPARIRPQGYGESQPVNDCRCVRPDPCNESQHQANRRTEFRFISLEGQPAPQ